MAVRAGCRVAFRTGADGFVYAWLAMDDTMEGARELGRVSKQLMNEDRQLWEDFKAMASSALNRIVADIANVSIESVHSEEEEPKEKPA